MSNPLYAITDSHLLPGERLYTAVTEALHGGCRRIQYRDKSSDSAQRTRQADRLLKLCDDHGAQLLINDDLDLALASGAHGVHLGQADAHPREARRRLGPDAIIGVTCHASLDLAHAAVRSGADYVAFGRFFPSRTKPDAPHAPLSLLMEGRQALNVPLVAIGGITLDNASAVLAAGAHWLAVCHSLFSAPDIAARCRAFDALVAAPNRSCCNTAY